MTTFLVAILVFLSMQRPTQQRKHTVTGVSIFGAASLYGTLSSFVYLTFTDKVGAFPMPSLRGTLPAIYAIY